MSKTFIASNKFQSFLMTVKYSCDCVFFCRYACMHEMWNRCVNDWFWIAAAADDDDDDDDNDDDVVGGGKFADALLVFHSFMTSINISNG